MKNALYIQAMNVHVGGGRSLLLPLLEAITPEHSIVALVDQRIELPAELPKSLSVIRVPPSVRGRWLAERWLKGVVTANDVVLCFGNLPPLNGLKGRVLVFVQNRLLVEEVSLRTFSLKPRMRLFIERIWLRRYAGHANYFVVQTPSMRRLLATKLRIPESTIVAWPFTANPTNFSQVSLTTSRQVQTSNDFDFIYPASGDPHKNHRNLVEAWVSLAKDGFFPSLCLTIDTVKYPILWKWIDLETKKTGLKIFNLGFLQHEDLLLTYSRAKALIYPSLLESFGLPLLEAQVAGLPVVAAELDYVRDILSPAQVFDPNSPLSIARAVKRFLGNPESDLKLLNANEFLERTLRQR